MKKLLRILVLGLLLSGCATQYISDEVSLWQMYKDAQHPYKAYGVVYNWKQRGYSYGKFFMGDYDSLNSLFSRMHKSEWCTKGCKIEYIGNEKVSEERQKEIASNHLPPGLVSEMFSKPVKKVAKKTTEKKKETKEKSEASGSAFFISNKGHIITNYHVVEDCKDNSKIFYKNNNVDAKLIAKDAYLDLALLKAEVNNSKFISISNMAPKKLQRIIAAGYPFGKYLSDDLKFTSGIVSSLKGVQDDSTRLQIDAALNPGNSGGPIIDENTGKLVAVAVAGLRKDVTEAVNFGIKAGSVKNFLESNQINISTFSKSYSRGEIAGLLEKTVLYTFCN